MRLFILFIILTGCSGYNVKINGINPQSFKEKSIVKIGIGMISSLAVHEAGHFLFGGDRFDFSERSVMDYDYYNKSHSEQQMFNRGGFLAQIGVGTALTIIPKFRHSDFTLGFNSFTAINTAIYTITGGGKYSDIEQLDHGVAEGLIYTGYSGVLTYINLKEK